MKREKLALGPVEFNGCDLPAPTLWVTEAVLDDPDDRDPSGRFKIAFEAPYTDSLPQGMFFAQAFSPDGLALENVVYESHE